MTGNGNCTEERGWTISAPDATWDQAIRQGLNLGIAFRRHGMRYRDREGGGAGSTTADNRVSMMSDLLGITTWNPSRAGGPSPALAVDPASPAPPVALASPAPPAPPVPPMALMSPMAPVAPPANVHRNGERPTDSEPVDHGANDELPAWEHDRQPRPQRAILDADMWQGAPAEQAPKAVRVKVSTAPRAASIIRGLTAALDPSAGPPDLGAPAAAREQQESHSYSQRTPGKPRHPTGSTRERLRMQRVQQKRRRRRFRLATVAAVTLIAASVTTSLALHHGGGTNVKVHAAAPGFGYSGPYAPVTLNADNSVTMAQPGVTQPIVDVYEDFLCSACSTFEKGSGAAIQRLADEGKVKVVYYPFTASGSQSRQASSIRAWAAAKCAPANLWARYHNSLYASQPAQTAASGFVVNLLVQLGRSAGITSTGFAQCVQSQQYAIEDLPLSDQIINSGVGNMLTIMLNGKVLNPGLTSSELSQQIISASR